MSALHWKKSLCGVPCIFKQRPLHHPFLEERLLKGALIVNYCEGTRVAWHPPLIKDFLLFLPQIFSYTKKKTIPIPIPLSRFGRLFRFPGKIGPWRSRLRRNSSDLSHRGLSSLQGEEGGRQLICFDSPWPIGSMYGLFTYQYIHHKNQPNVGNYMYHYMPVSWNLWERFTVQFHPFLCFFHRTWWEGRQEKLWINSIDEVEMIDERSPRILAKGGLHRFFERSLFYPLFLLALFLPRLLEEGWWSNMINKNCNLMQIRCSTGLLSERYCSWCGDDNPMVLTTIAFLSCTRIRRSMIKTHIIIKLACSINHFWPL